MLESVSVSERRAGKGRAGNEPPPTSSTFHASVSACVIPFSTRQLRMAALLILAPSTLGMSQQRRRKDEGVSGSRWMVAGGGRGRGGGRSELTLLGPSRTWGPSSPKRPPPRQDCVSAHRESDHEHANERGHGCGPSWPGGKERATGELELEFPSGAAGQATHSFPVSEAGRIAFSVFWIDCILSG